MRKFYRIVQFLTGVNRIHHLQYSYGFKLPFVKIGWFDKYGWKNFSKDNYKCRKGNDLKSYHNCTLTGVY